MQPRMIHVPAFAVAGLSVRTRNGDEANPATARIGALWDQFFSRSWARELPGPGADGRLYGVYSAYESNEQGAFDVTAGVAAARAHPEVHTTQVDVHAGDYLVFRSEGAMPQMVMDGWSAVWRYFVDHPEARRRFATDFECYEGPDCVAIHIGIVRNAEPC